MEWEKIPSCPLCRVAKNHPLQKEQSHLPCERKHFSSVWILNVSSSFHSKGEQTAKCRQTPLMPKSRSFPPWPLHILYAQWRCPPLPPCKRSNKIVFASGILHLELQNPGSQKWTPSWFMPAGKALAEALLRTRHFGISASCMQEKRNTYSSELVFLTHRSLSRSAIMQTESCSEYLLTEELTHTSQTL